MSINEKKFRKAALTYAGINGSENYKFFSKVNCKGIKEIIAKVPLRDEWTKLFFFNGEDRVDVKNRMSDRNWERYTLDEFIQYVALRA